MYDRAKDRLTIAAFRYVRWAQKAVVRKRRGERVKSTFAVIHFTVSSN
jgi:hypothetical protein